ncbi:adhesin [Haemophilus sp. HMSC61B11]|uniref:YadA-like family protein n=1 Tax=Haemophilus sp. HMSC61B11 TaxID=1608882 RepID=UPI00091591B2|nr:YadA-like family protein [Haemophilus sp. HMSC61B11]OHR64935.1 adhesin [Haemophilus sp. HMSC61B11]
MNKIFKVIWCSSSQVWVAVSELSKVKPVSSVSSVKKTSSAVSTLLKTTALAIPFALSPLAAHAYVAIGGTASNNNGSWFSESGATATPKQGAALTWAYDYKNPGNKSYANANGASNRADSYADNGLTAYGVAIGNKSNALDDAGSSNGIAIGDYSDASGGLATSIGAFSHATNTGSTAIGTASRAAGFNSLAMMRQSAAIGDYSAAIGSVAYAKGSASFAFGASATANGDQSIAIGNTAPKTLDGLPGSGSEARRTRYDGENNTQTNGDRSVAIGSGAKTNGDDSFAFGSLAKTGEFSLGKDAYIEGNVTRPNTPAAKAIAFGTSSSASGNKSIAFGYNTLGGSENSIAFGVEAKAHKKDGIAFGSSANASEANSIAFGGNAQALHENVITIGKDSKATKKGAMTIGEGAQSNANNSLALGNGTIINQEDIKNKNAKYTNDGFEIENGVVAIANKGKERRLVNLAAGREDTDAVNVKQLSEVNDNLAKSIAGPNYNGYTVDGNGRYTYKAPDFEIKNQTLHNVKEAVELAQTNYVSVKSTIDPKTAGSNYDNKGAQGAGSIALGESTGTNAAAVDSVAIGRNTKVNGKNTVAIGANITAATNGSVILGDSSKADGSHATETVASKEIDGHTYTFEGKAKDAGRFVSVGEKGNERQIKNVAAGHVESNSTDAINGSQLYAVASRVEQGWKITAAQTGTGEVSGNAEKKVAMGDTVTFTAGNNIKITQNEKNLTVATKENVTFTNVTTGNTSLDDKGLTIKNGPSVTKDGVNAGNKKITNVEDGKISADSKDAVNGSQLHATNQNVTNNANNIANNAQNITKNAQNITKNAENIAKGLNFKGDNADVTVNRQLGETLNVTGGADKNNLSDNNIGVIGESNPSAATGGLAIKLAKDLKGLNSVETKQIKLGDNSSNTTIKYEGDRIKYGDKTVANLDDEKHITNTTYAVGNDGNVSLTYTDGKGNVVNGMTATITGVAKNDLSNINNDGKKVITGLGTIVEAADSSVTVTNTTDAVGRTTYKVKANVPGADAFNIKYKANGANEQTVTLNKGLDFTDGNFTTASVAENGVVKYDVKTGNITNGVDGKTGVNGNDGLATVKTVVEAINNSGWLANATKSTGELDGTSTATKVKPGAVVNFDAGKNLKVKQTLNGDDHTYTYSLDSNLTNLDKVVVNSKDGVDGKDGVTITGPNGAKGEDGKVGITGKDGKDAVSIAGKDGVGHIGLTGPKGADGSDGKSVDISTNDGTQTLVNQEPGTDKSQRIVYTPKDKDGNPIKGKDGKDIVREVATMDDGLKFAGDDGQTDDSKVIAKKLNQKVDIVGGADKTKLTENNIGVNNKDGKLNVQLSKDINLTDAGSIKFGDDLTINNNGLTIKDGPSITKTGIDGGNKQIKNVAEGTEDNDAVTVKQLKDSKTALVNGKNTTVTGTGTSVDPYKVNVEGALTDITSITNKDGNGKVEFAADQVVNVAGDNPIKLDAKTGDITSLTNKTIDGSDFATKGRAATEEQLKATGDQITNNLTKKGLNFGAQSGEVIHKNLGDQLDIVGEGTKADDRYDATNIKTMTKDGKVVVGLAKDLTADNVTVGQKGENGKDGVDGQIGVNGKDGSGVAINGKDGSISLKGKDGENAVTIKTAEGPAGVNGKDGETKPRLVVNNEKVATLKDGLKFKGDKGDSIAKELNEELEILGKLDPNAAVTDKNLRVDNDAGKLVLKMAKQLQDLTSATFIDETTGNKSVINGNGLTVTPKDADNTKTVSVTDKGLNNGGNQIVNVDSGLKDATGNKVALEDATGNTLNNAVNVGDLKDTIGNITNNGFGLTDENGNDVKAKLGETVTVKGDGSVTTKVIEEGGKAKLQVGLNKDVTIGNDKEPGTITVKGENGKDGISINGKDGTIGLKGEDGKDGIALNGKDGTIGINGKDGSNGKITVAQGQAGLDGNDGKDGKTKTRIVYEKPNGDKEEVATLNDGLKFTGNNEVVNSHKLNTLVTIKGEGIDKAASDAFKSASGNVNVKADGKGTLEVQLAKDLKNIDSISNKDGQKIEFKDGGTTISGGNVSVDGNKITDVKAGEDDTDAVNVKQLKDGIAQATTKVAAGKNVTVEPKKNADGSTTYTVATKDDVDFTSVTTGKTTMNDGGITIKAAEGGKTNVTLTNKGLDNGGNKVVNVADGDISATSKDAVNGSQLHNTKVELTNKGLDFGAQSGADIHKNLGEKLEIVGEGTKADDRYDATNIKTMTKDGKVVIGLDKDLKSDSVTVGSVGKDGKPGVDGKVGVNGKDGSSVVINGKDGSIGLTGPKGADGKSPSITVRTENGTTTVNEKDAGKPVERIKYTDSNNNTREVATLDDGLKFTGDDGKTVNRTLGSNLNIKGGAKDATSKDNIRITNDGKNGLKVQLANNVTLDNNGSVNIGGTRVDDNGITTNNGKGPSVTNNGVNAGNQKITNVKDGAVNATSKDAVNGSQLHRAVQNIDNKFGDVYGKMNKINKEARAGIAGANAAAGLPQVYLPGKSMVAASAGTFKGQNALAIGYSRSSDNGKVILKLQGNANTQGDVGGSVGVGYQW